MAMHRNTDAIFDPHGVTADQFVLLLALEGKSLTQRELADRISSDPSTVRAMLVLLERSGLVERGNHPTDSRAKLVSLTTLGKRKLRILWDVGQSIRESMYGCLSAEDAELLVALLRKIADSLKQERSLV